MPVSQTWDTQDAVPEWLKDHVVEQEGKWVFSAETASEVGNLKKTLNTERTGRTTYEKQLKQFERFKPLMESGEDAVDEFLDGWAKRGEKKNEPDKSTDLEARAQARKLKEATEEVEKLKPLVESLTRDLREYKLWTPLRDLFVKAGGDEGKWKAARLILSEDKRFDFDPDDDKKIVVMEDGAISSLTPERYFKELFAEQYAYLYKPTGAGGSGASPGNGRHKSQPDYSKLPAEERLKIARREHKGA